MVKAELTDKGAASEQLGPSWDRDGGVGPSPVAERTRCVEFTQTQDPLTALGVSCEMDLGPGQMLVDRCSQHTPITR